MPASHARDCGDASATPAPDALPDYELLELILRAVLPPRYKPLAKAILAQFGTFAEALNAPDERLREVPGLSEAAITEIKLVRAVALRLVRGEMLERPVLSSRSEVLDYCRASGLRSQGAVSHHPLNVSIDTSPLPASLASVHRDSSLAANDYPGSDDPIRPVSRVVKPPSGALDQT